MNNDGGEIFNKCHEIQKLTKIVEGSNNRVRVKQRVILPYFYHKQLLRVIAFHVVCCLRFITLKCILTWDTDSCLRFITLRRILTCDTDPKWQTNIDKILLEYFNIIICTQYVQKLDVILEIFLLKRYISEILALYRKYLQCKANISATLTFHWKYL